MFKNFKIPHTFTIVFIITIVCAILTWIIPGGEFTRQTLEINGHTRTIVVPDSFQYIENVPQTWQIFTAFFKGFERTAQIIVFILMIGGAFWIINSTSAINIGIFSFLKQTQKLQKIKFFKTIGVNNLIIILIMLLFSLFGAVFGMSEETIAFVGIFVPLSISMGYDSIVGLLICYVAAHTGFAGAMLNPFTIGIAQGLSSLPTFSGLEYRIICWLILTTIAIVFTLFYAARIKKNPQKSIMYELDNFWRKKNDNVVTEIKKQNSTLSAKIVYASITLLLIICAIKFPETNIAIGNTTYTFPFFKIFVPCFALVGFFTLKNSIHNFILTILFTTIVLLIIGVLGYNWYIQEIAALFFAMGFAVSFAFGFSFDKAIRLFLEGCKDIMTAALIVGMAGGIILILEDGKIIDTILFAISQTMTHTGKEGAVAAMYSIQNILNIIIPSGSAKAALTIPMMAEFSDIIGVSRQITILAFQFGDGFTNMITPTSGVLIACIGVARVPYAKWAKFILPFIIVLFIIGFILLLPPLNFTFNGF